MYRHLALGFHVSDVYRTCTHSTSGVFPSQVCLRAFSLAAGGFTCSVHRGVDCEKTRTFRGPFGGSSPATEILYSDREENLMTLSNFNCEDLRAKVQKTHPKYAT